MPQVPVQEFFNHAARKVSGWAGSQWAFLISIAVIAVWAVTGPIFRFSDTWQLVINTGTTIITFLMVFLIQNSQNRDSRAIHLKLDEIIHCMDSARDNMIDLEEASDAELAKLQKEFEKIKAAGGNVSDETISAIAEEREDRAEEADDGRGKTETPS